MVTDSGAFGAGREAFARAPRPRRPGLIAGTLASLGIIGLCAAVMATWSAGPGADMLLGILALGFLLRIPAAGALWAVLALLACAAAALAAGDQPLADGVGNLLYLALAAACLWQLWALALERAGWRPPLADLVRRAGRRGDPAAEQGDAAWH